MLKARSRKFRLALLCGTLVIALLAMSIPNYQYLAHAVKHLSSAKAVGSFQAPVVTIFRDDFETDRGWITNPNATDTAASAWRRDVSAPASLRGDSTQIANANAGNNALVMGRFGGAYARSRDDGGGVSSILSPEITMPSAGTLTLSFNSYFARSGKSSGKDFLRASIVSSDGARPALTVSGDDNAAAGAWVLQSVSLNHFAGQTILILFQTADGAGAGAVEVAVDDVAVTSSEEIALIEPQAITNVALNKPATGSAPCNANEGPAKAFNGSFSGGNSDKWCSQASAKFLQVDLGQNFNITSFVVRHASAGGESASFNTRAFNIQVSANGTNFTSLVNVTNNTQGVTTHPITATAARFVRLNITQSEQTNNITARIYELEVFADVPTGGCSGVNVARGKAATGSAPCNANEGPAKAFNGSVSGGNSDKWCSSAAPRFLQVDLAGSFDVTCFRLSHAGAGGESAALNTRDFNIQTSVDGTNFVTAVNVTGNTQNVTDHSIAGRQARFVRLNVTTPTQNGTTAARIYEFEVFGTGGGLPSPPETIQEHWFEHNLLVRLVRFNDDAAIYFDDDVDRAQADWILNFTARTWRYYKQTYGPFGADPRGYSIHHQGRFFGGHPGDYFSALHDFLNSSDIGVNSWVESGGNHDLISHEFMHVVESANNNVHGSPAFGIWGDSKWAEFAQYDLYIGLGMQQDADRVFNLFMNARDNFPRPNTAWFRDWFFPLWRDHGRAQVMVRFFSLLAQHFPKETQNHGNGPHAHYTRGMNMGEFVHFMSGAAGTNLSSMATTAFGAGTGNWETQFQQARINFPAITY
jgi:hypothetical protein